MLSSQDREIISHPNGIYHNKMGLPSRIGRDEMKILV